VPSASANLDFRALVERFRGGDQEAAAELLRRYEPQVRRFIRMRLTDPQLRRVVNSSDIFQSVFLSCLVKLREGYYDPQEPGELLRLLATIAVHKIIDKANQAANRRAERGGAALLDGLAEDGQSPSAALALRELLEKVAELLTEEELRLARLRAEGRTWAEVAEEVEGEPEALRKRLERALRRVRELFRHLEADDE
jgi:RNA polymerase sigma-70 factor (ECF subfamily)